jgi:hypothetical protein
MANSHRYRGDKNLQLPAQVNSILTAEINILKRKKTGSGICQDFSWWHHFEIVVPVTRFISLWISG